MLNTCGVSLIGPIGEGRIVSGPYSRYCGIWFDISPQLLLGLNGFRSEDDLNIAKVKN